MSDTDPPTEPHAVRSYPPGAPCWVDTVQPDLEAAQTFYGGLFGWTFADAMPPDAPGQYLVASLDGRGVAAIGPGDGPARWQTYVSVADTDAAAAAVEAAGGAVTQPPWDAGPGGRGAACTDPSGAAFLLWQPRRRPGADLVNAPGSWVFSHLHTHDRERAVAFYGNVFGWAGGDGPAPSVRLPGYGQHLADTVDPDIFERQAKVHAPEGYADVVAGYVDAGPDEPEHWQVVFSTDDRDAAAERVQRLGGAVLSTSQDRWTRGAVVRDPQGATFALSQFVPSFG